MKFTKIQKYVIFIQKQLIIIKIYGNIAVSFLKM